MNLEFVPVQGQKFDIGRTINPFKCDCMVCTFMNCPKKNYAVKMTRKKYTVNDFWNEHKNEILELNHPKRWEYGFHNKFNLRMTFDMLSDFFDFLYFTFPKGLYWSHDNPESYDDGDIGSKVYKEIGLVKFSRSGNEIRVGRIKVATQEIYDYDLSERQYKLAEKISSALAEVKRKVFEYYEEQDKDWVVGWLSPEGRHYPCDHCDHSLLARYLGGDELFLEGTGWAKIALPYEEGVFLGGHFPTAAQRNWLSMHGFNVDEMFD